MKVKNKCVQLIGYFKFNICNDPNNKQSETKNGDEPADFETAISATGFGKFNILLMTVIAFPAAWASMLASSSMSYVLPIAQCDLNLTLQDKGLLNGVTYLGMVSTGFLWGFLSDTLGRRKLLVTGFLLDGVFVILAGSTQIYTVVVVAKFMSGCIINGPFAVLTTTLSEFHSAKNRARILLFMGFLYSTANIILPLLGWAILPRNIDINLFNGYVILHSWNIFILVCSLPSIFSGTFLIFLPESPKFLMTVGKNEKALTIFQKIYKWNTGKAIETYPVKVLLDENNLQKLKGNKHGGFVTANRTKAQALKEGWQQIMPLFYPPHRLRILLVCLIQTGIMMGLNTLRLWLPQIFTAINDYEMLHQNDASLCIMLDSAHHVNQTTDCSVNNSNDAVYINSIIVALACMAAYILAGVLVNIIGKKTILLLFGLPSGLLIIGLYFCTDSQSVVALTSLFIALLGVCTNITLTVVVDLFPTTLRTMTVCFTMMSGRLGAMAGNLIFPYLLALGCLPPFGTIGGVIILGILMTKMLPKTDLKALK